jgi:tetratricopeptide (TPR) repeat protein/CHAT domain-containing protein
VKHLWLAVAALPLLVSPASAAPALDSVFADEFRTDSRDQYQLAGPVRWAEGRLSLDAGASITRTFRAGPVAELHFRLNIAPLSHDGDECETRLGLTIDGAGVGGVAVLRKRSDGKTAGDIGVLHAYDRTKPAAVLRRFPCPPPGPGPEDWTLRYNHGAFRLSRDGRPVAAGFIDCGTRPLLALRLVQTSGTADCRALRLSAAAAPAPPGAQQQKELDEADKANDEAVRLANAGKGRDALALMRQAHDIRQRVLGERHHDTLLSLVNLATQLSDLGDRRQARADYEQALRGYKELLGDDHPTTAWVLGSLGALLEEVGELPAARLHLEQALQVDEEVLGDRHSQTGTAHGNLGSVLRDLGDPAAQGHFEEALRIAKGVHGDKHPETAHALNNLARLLAAHGESAAAQEYYEQALKIDQEVLGKDHPETAATLTNLGSVLQARGDYAAARSCYEQALSIRQRAFGEEHPLVGQALGNLGAALLELGDYTAARPYLDRALTVDRKALGDRHRETATALNNLGHLHCDLGEYAEARRCFDEALAIRKEVLGDRHPLTALSLNSLGYLLATVGDYAAALDYYGQALAIRKEVLGDRHPDTATTLNNIGGVLNEQGRYAEARAYYEQALKIRRAALGDKHPRTLQSLNNLGSVLHDLGDTASARAYYQQAVRDSRAALGDRHPETAVALDNLGCLLEEIDEPAEARRCHEEALDIRRATLGNNHPLTAAALNNLGCLLHSQGDLAGARKCHEEALRIRRAALGDRHPDTAASLNNLGVVLEELGDGAGALRAHQEALRIRRATLGDRHVHTAQSLINMAGVLQEAGDDAAARPLLEEAVRVETGLADDLLPTMAEAEGLAYAEGFWHRAQPLLSVLRARGAAGADAYRVVWEARALATRAVAGRRRLPADDPEARRLEDRLRALRKELAELTLASPPPEKADVRQRRLVELNREKEEAERDLARASAAFRRERQVRHAEPADLARLLPARTAVVDVVQVNVYRRPAGGGALEHMPEYEAFVLRRADGDAGCTVAWKHLGPAALIDEAVAQWRAALRPDGDRSLSGGPSREGTRPAPATAGPPEQRLRRLVWDPLEPELQGCSTVLVIPDGTLSRVPWSALPGRQPGSYLLEDYAVGTAANGQALYDLLSREPPRGDRFLLVGGVQYDAAPVPASGVAVASAGRGPAGPNGDRPRWGLLPGSLDEAHALAGLWGRPDRLVSLEGAAATEEALRRGLPGARYVHLATHGFFADARFRSAFQQDVAGERLQVGRVLMAGRRSTVTERNPLILSGVVLAGANRPPATNDWGAPLGDDGILTAEEVAELDLHDTELVVLSGCETALGDVAGGEGVFGLQRGFALAGARASVASLWQVDDQVTRRLMARFYENLWHKGMGRLEALRQAQLSVLREPGPSEGAGRGVVHTARPAEAVGGRTPAPLWAAWVLSGDPGEPAATAAPETVAVPAGSVAVPVPAARSRWPLYAGGGGAVLVALAAVGLSLARRRGRTQPRSGDI